MPVVGLLIFALFCGLAWLDSNQRAKAVPQINMLPSFWLNVASSKGTFQLYCTQRPGVANYDPVIDCRE